MASWDHGAGVGDARGNVGMHHLKRFLSKSWQDESGATAIEYGLIAAAIALAIIAILNGIGLHLADMLASLNASLK